MTPEEKAKRKARVDERKKLIAEKIEKEHKDVALIMDAMRGILSNPAAAPETALAAAIVLSESLQYHNIIPDRSSVEDFIKAFREKLNT